MRLAIVASHPIQYQAPLFRELARRLDVAVYFAHRATPLDQAAAGFGVVFDWDVDLTSGYEAHFLTNVARAPSPSRFWGCDTPDIGAMLRHGRFDALLVMGWHLKSFWQAIWAAKRLGLPVLVRGDSQLSTPRGAMKRLGKELIYPWALGVFDAALYVGARSREYWEHYHYPRDRMFFSPHCVDTQWFAARATVAAREELRTRLGIAPDAKVALFAGKLLAFKRPLDLLAAAAALQPRGVTIEVLMAGAGPLGDELSAAADAAGIHLHLLGFCNQSEIPRAYAAADCLVLPSEHETWGLVANEALACGQPIVVSDACGCAPDLAGDGGAGRVFEVGDSEALARALEDVMSQPPSLQSLRDRSEKYSLVAAAQGIEQALAFAVRRASRAESVC